MDYKNPAPSSSYASKDFQKIFPEMLDLIKKLTYRWDPSISNESDPGVILVKLNALINDKSNYNIDKAMLEYFPETVTQEQDAYSMFRQLGYYPKWFMSATTNAVFKYKRSEDDTSSGIVTIPIFTQLSDDSRSLVYTITGEDVSLDLSGENFSSPVGITQGTIHEYTINGDSLIRFSDLDSKRRLYFDELNVAQNGIFIYNDGLKPQPKNFWKITDNIYSEELVSIPGGETDNYFSFGLSRDLGRCYVEFAEDAEECIGGGIHIMYLTSDGFDGNVPARGIDRLFENGSFEINETDPVQMISLSEENLIIRNEESAVNGGDSETIDEMYTGYKRTVGTFNTLVTIRDYINYVLSTGLVSNGFVCDRLDDIQSSYKIVTLDNDIDIVKNCVIKDEGVDELSAYDLRMYLNKINTDPLTSLDSFHYTFDFVPSNSVIVKNITGNMIEYTKCVLHDFKNILKSEQEDKPENNGKIRFVGFRCVYEIDCKIIPQYDITTTQRKEIETNIRNNIYKNFCAQKLTYGIQTEYDDVYRTILESDERIKSVYLSDFAYKIQYVYWNGNSFEVKEELDDRDKNEIIARSVLAGITQGVSIDSKFTYNLNMCVNSVFDDVQTIEPSSTITWNSSSAPNYSFKISDKNENQNIVFFAPAYTEKVEYSTYTKYKYSFTNTTVKADTETKIASNDWIEFSWTDSNGVAQIKRYTSTQDKPVVIKSSFEIAAGTISEYESLGNNKKISILGDNVVTLNSGTSCYWILNHKTYNTSNGESKYTLFAEGSTEYMLGYGEYFVYTNTDKTIFEILGSGTKLVRSSNAGDWMVDTIDPEKILEDGLNAEIEWFSIPNNCTLTATEMRIVTIGSDTEINITNAQSFTTEWNGNTEYDVVASNISYSYGGDTVELEKIGSGWKGMSILNVKASPYVGQMLFNDSTGGSQEVIINNNASTKISGPGYFKSSSAIEFPGAKSIDVKNYNVEDNTFSNISLIGYEESSWGTSTAGVTIEPVDEGYKVTLPYSDSDQSYTISIDNCLPNGSYMFAVAGANSDINISNVSAVRTGTTVSVLSNSSTCKYFKFDVSGEIGNANRSTSITIPRESKPDLQYAESVTIRPLIKYSDGNINFSDSSNSSVENIIKSLDVNNEFDYGYIVNEDTEIKDPTDPVSFFDPNHIFNKFTLPYISNISIQTTNVVKGK